jgi:hypothetical protein
VVELKTERECRRRAITDRYVSGNTSATFGLLRAHGGMIDDRKPAPLPGGLVDPTVVHPRGHHRDEPAPVWI